MISCSYAVRYKLDLVSWVGGASGLKEEEFSVTPLSWIDHFLMSFRLVVVINLCRAGKLVKIMCCRFLIFLEKFSNGFGEFPVLTVGNIEEALLI